jgi:hypothetical protein
MNIVLAWKRCPPFSLTFWSVAPQRRFPIFLETGATTRYRLFPSVEKENTKAAMARRTPKALQQSNPFVIAAELSPTAQAKPKSPHPANPTPTKARPGIDRA